MKKFYLAVLLIIAACTFSSSVYSQSTSEKARENTRKTYDNAKAGTKKAWKGTKKETKKIVKGTSTSAGVTRRGARYCRLLQRSLCLCVHNWRFGHGCVSRAFQGCCGRGF